MWGRSTRGALREQPPVIRHTSSNQGITGLGFGQAIEGEYRAHGPGSISVRDRSCRWLEQENPRAGARGFLSVEPTLTNARLVKRAADQCSVRRRADYVRRDGTRRSRAAIIDEAAFTQGTDTTWATTHAL